MFFIGLAGSFMPYLLLFGALFVLTLGVDFRGDAHEEVAETNEKTIEYKDSEEQSKQSTYQDNNYYFFQTSKKVASDYSVTQTALFKVDDFLMPKPKGEKLIATFHLNYSFDVYHPYLGLSPPVMIS